MSNKIFDYAYAALKSVIEDKKEFFDVLNLVHTSVDVSNDEYKEIVSLSGTVLRHYLLLNHAVNKNYFVQDSNCKLALAIYLCNKIYFKKISDDESVESVISVFNNSGVEFDQELFDSLKNKCTSKDNLIDENVEPESDKYLSLKFNAPIWLVRMWRKHYKDLLTNRILSSISRPIKHFYRVSKNVNIEEIVGRNIGFAKVDGYENYVTYDGKIPPRKLREIEQLKVIDQSLSTIAITDNSDPDILKGIAVYSGFENKLFLELVAKLGTNVKMDLMCSNPLDYLNNKKFIEEKKLDGISLYEIPASAMVTCVSKPVHTFYLFPNNSRFDQLRVTPDFFLKSDSNLLDSYIEEGRTCLKEASSLVEDGGQIVLAVPTLSNKETRFIVREFVKEHPNFTISFEKQYFPFDKYQSTLYVAVLTKQEKDD